MRKLEAFQGELVKRILKWPKHLSNTVATATLEVPPIRCRVLEAKHGFLHEWGSKPLMICVVEQSCHYKLCDDFDSSCLHG